MNGTLKVELVHRTVYPTRKKPWKTLRDGSSSAIIGLVSTRDSVTGLRKKSWTSYLKGQEAA